VKICQLCAVDFTMARLLLPLCTAMRDAGHEVVAICSDGPLLERVEAAGIRCRPVPIARSMNPFKAMASARPGSASISPSLPVRSEKSSATGT